ncbi:MAG: PKD domain-containing protein [Thermoanaerobaculia bacterium]|nr:PKD domain-containing protein [Thermoanaerobaculia bacterium]
MSGPSLPIRRSGLTLAPALFLAALALPSAAEDRTTLATYPPCFPVTLTANDVRGRPPLTFTWTLPNGAGTLTGNPTTLDTNRLPAGFHTIQLEIRNAHGVARSSISLVVESLGFATTPTATRQPDGSYRFHAQTSGATEWRWTWGDGTGTPWLTGCDGLELEHRFPAPGTYTVTVEARNCRQPAISRVFTVQVVQQILEIATFQPSCPTTPYCTFPTGAPVPFAQSIAGPAALYLYDWNGDGFDEEVSAAPVLSHAYPSPGFYLPRLTVFGVDQAVSRSAPAPIQITGSPLNLIFADGFETGNLSRWSSHVP